MKILILCNNASGLAIFRGMLVEELIKSGCLLYAVVPQTQDKSELQAENRLKKAGCTLKKMPIDRRGINPFKDFRLFLRYLKYISSVNPDKIITYTIKPNIYGGLASRILHKKYYTNITGMGTAFEKNGLFKKFIVSLYKSACKNAGCIFFQNTQNKKFFTDAKIVPENRTCLLNGSGVDLEKFSLRPYPQERTFIKFLFIGRVMKEKGIDELLSAADRIYNEFHNIKLDIAGFTEEDEYLRKMHEREEKGYLSFHGFKSDVRPLIEKAHCLILPSYHEGMANTLLEAGAMGRPLITSDIPGCREAVSENKTGFLVKVSDSGDLYEKMKLFINLPHDKKAEMGREAHNLIAKRFDKRDVVEKTLETLKIPRAQKKVRQF